MHRIRHGSLIAGLLAGIVLVPRSSYAQYTANFQTNIISGVTSNWSGNNYAVGYTNFADVLLVQDSGVLSNGIGYVGLFASSSNNSVLVTGSGSVWSNSNDLYIGFNGAGNSLTISNGGVVYSGGVGILGVAASSINNTVLVTGTGSVWSSSLDLLVGFNGAGNSLTISNGGVVYDGVGVVGASRFSSNNTVLVTGAGSVWNNGLILIVGHRWSSNHLVIATGGSVVASNAFIGYSDPFDLASNNVIQVNGGSLIVTNGAGDGALVVSRAGGSGRLTLNSGTVTVNQLILTNGVNSVVGFNGGVLNSGGAFVTNGSTFVVGDGASAAIFHLLGGIHSFNNGLRVPNNATLRGCGTINGTVVVDAGGMVLADCGGTLTFTDSITNNGTMRAINGTTLEFYGPVVNNEFMDVIVGNTNFHSVFINNGILLDADGDWDGDGFTGLQEYLAGTDPTNSASSFRITSLVSTDHNVLVTWTTVTGKTNALQSAAGGGGYFTNSFTTIFTVTNTTGTSTNYLDVGAATNVPSLFYRVRLVP